MAERKIILGGDDEYFRGPLFTHLEEAGYAVVLVSRTADVVRTATAEARELALMVLDLNRPRIDVAAVLKSLAAEQPNLKVPIVGVRSGREEPSRIQALKQAGVRTFVDRETPLNEMLYLVRQVVAPSVAERRKHPRVPSNIPVEFWAEEASRRSGFVTDISEGGIFIETLDRYVLGETVSVRFTLAEMGWKVQGKGEVVYISPKLNRKTALLPGMGIKFRAMPPAHVDAIRAYVESVLRRLPDLYQKSLIGIDKSAT